MIGDLSQPHTRSDDVIAWEGVVVDPDGVVDQAIRRRAPMAGRAVLEIGHSSISYAVKHAEWAAQVYAAKFDNGLCSRTLQPVGLPPNMNLVRCDATGLPLRDAMVDLAILREPFPGSDEASTVDAVDEALRVLKAGQPCVALCLNFTEGDLGTLIGSMMAPEDPAVAQERKASEWLERGFKREQIPALWRAPGRTILRRVLLAEFAGLPQVHLAENIAVSELSCAFDLYWLTK